MKRLAFILFILAITVHSQPFTLKDTAFVNTINPPASSGPTYLLSWNAESGTEPSGWGHIGSGVNWNYTTTVLEGTKSLGILGTVDSAATNVNFAAQSALWVLYQFRVTALPSGTINGLGITDSSGNAIAYVGLNSSGTLTVNIVGGGNSTTVSALSGATTYWIKQSFTKGSPGVATVEFSTTGTFSGSGNAFATTSLNPDNTSPGGISLENYSSGNTWIFDHGRVYNSDLGNSGNWP